MSLSYTLSRTPVMHHGEGMIKMINPFLAQFSKRVLLVTGDRSFMLSPAFGLIEAELSRRKLGFDHCRVAHEPSPALVDRAIEEFAGHEPEAVVALGGGSVLDAAKAIAAMMPLREPVKQYLEGVGTRLHPGGRLPFIALPTTSGTGSEATRNAVLSQVGPQGFKRSLRHMNFVADVAILDPLLTVTCPPHVTAYSGMDAFTQLLESYLSRAANPVTDALALQGLKLVSSSLVKAFNDGSDKEARSAMALASYLSGVTLTNAGLGTVHGLAGVIGGLTHIPHGMICSRLMWPANVVTVRRLRASSGDTIALSKYAVAGKLFCSKSGLSDEFYIDHLLTIIREWTDAFRIPGLRSVGLSGKDIERSARLGDDKNNPVELSHDERLEVLEGAG